MMMIGGRVDGAFEISKSFSAFNSLLVMLASNPGGISDL